MVCVAVRYDHGDLTVDAVKNKIRQCFPRSRYLVVRIEDVFPTIYAVFECDRTPECGRLSIAFKGEDDVGALYSCFVLDICTTWAGGKEWRDRLCRKAAEDDVFRKKNKLF